MWAALVFLGVTLSLPLYADLSPWARHAKRLGGISENARREALAALRGYAKLDATLLAALPGPEKPYALDAIVALQRTALVGPLIDGLARDDDGTIALALAALVTKETQQRIADAFVARLRAEGGTGLSAAGRMAMIDLLGRLGATLEVSDVRRWLADSFPEVRLSAVAFLRLVLLREKLLREKDDRFAALLERASNDDAWQVRLATLLVAKELGRSAVVDKGCRRERRAEVRPVCEKL